jgi:hypothetical protein
MVYAHSPRRPGGGVRSDLDFWPPRHMLVCGGIHMKKAIIYLAVFVLGVACSLGVQTVYGAEKYPHIRAALRELDGAKLELQNAAHDFGGHRAAALHAVEEAQVQLNAARNSER